MKAGKKCRTAVLQRALDENARLAGELEKASRSVAGFERYFSFVADKLQEVQERCGGPSLAKVAMAAAVAGFLAAVPATLLLLATLQDSLSRATLGTYIAIGFVSIIFEICVYIYYLYIKEEYSYGNKSNCKQCARTGKNIPR